MSMGSMSMGDRVVTVLGELLTTTVCMALDKNYVRGFDEASSACVGVLAEASDGLVAKMASGVKLSPQEQALYARLSEVKAEMEKRLEASYEPPSAKLNLP